MLHITGESTETEYTSGKKLSSFVCCVCVVTVVLYLCDTSGKVVQSQDLDCRLSELLPNQTAELKASFAYSKNQKYQVKFGIISPMTQVPSVHFAMKGFEGEVMPKLATIQKDQKGTDK